MLAHGPLRLGFPSRGHEVQAAQHTVNREDGVGALPVLLVLSVLFWLGR